MLQIPLKHIDRNLFLRWAAEQGFADRSEQFTQQQFQTLLSRIINGVFDEEITGEIFQKCVQNQDTGFYQQQQQQQHPRYQLAASFEDLIDTLISAEQQLLFNINQLSEFNTTILIDIEETKRQQQNLLLAANGRTNKPSAIRVQIHSINVSKESDFKSLGLTLFLKLQTLDGYLTTSHKEVSDMSFEAVEFESEFNILIGNEQREMEILVCATTTLHQTDDQDLILATTSLNLNEIKHRPNAQIQQRINCTPTEQSSISSCFIDITAQIMPDTKGYFALSLNQKETDLQENLNEKNQYMNDLLVIQMPYLQLQANSALIKHEQQQQQQEFNSQQQQPQQQSYRSQRKPPQNQSLSLFTGTPTMAFHAASSAVNLSEQQQQQQPPQFAGISDSSMKFQQDQQYVSFNPAVNVTQTSVAPPQEWKIDKDDLRNYLKIASLTYMVFTLFGAFDKACFFDLLCAAWLLKMFVIDNRTYESLERKEILSTQVFVVLAFVNDLIFLKVKDENNSIILPPIHTQDQILVKFLQNLYISCFLISVFNIILRAGIMLILISLEKLTTAKQPPPLASSIKSSLNF